jgi:hypothetical protein
MNYLNLQQAQYLGDFTEYVDVPVKAGTDNFLFPQVSEELKKADIIGLAVLVGDGTIRSLVSNQVLLTAAQMAGAILQIEAKNRKKTNIPLRLFILDGKPMIYLPINIQQFNPAQSKIIFPVNIAVTGIIQIVFFTAQ